MRDTLGGGSCYLGVPNHLNDFMMYLTGQSREKVIYGGKGTVSLVGPFLSMHGLNASRKVGKLDTVLNLDGAAQYPMWNGNGYWWS